MRAAQPAGPADDEELACGVDVVDIHAFAEVVRARGASFLTRVFTRDERRECGRSMARLAARFAAKEATVKALGTGLAGIVLRDIEVTEDTSGKPHLRLSGTAAAKARALGLWSWAVSLSHSARVASAMVVARRRTWPEDVPFITALAAARRAGGTRVLR